MTLRSMLNTAWVPSWPGRLPGGRAAFAGRVSLLVAKRLQLLISEFREHGIATYESGVLEARDAAAAELGQHVLWLEPELLQQAGVALGIDLVGQLLLRVLGLVGLPLLVEHVEDLVLGDLHGRSFRLHGWGLMFRAT